MSNESDPPEPPPLICAGVSSHWRVGLDQSHVQASGLNLGSVEEENAADRDHVSSGEEGGSSGDVWKEKAAAQIRFAKGRTGSGRKKGSKREEGSIKPPVIFFSDVEDSDNLRPPELTHEQAMAAAALASAALEAPQNSDSTWRAIIDAHTSALARSCVTLELTALAFRGAWYDRDEKTLDPERLKH